MNYKIVIAVRKDLKLSQGKLAVQVAHASVLCALKAKREKRRWFNNWLKEGQRKVVVRAEDREELTELKRNAESKGLITALIEDAGLTEIPPGTVTCLGIGPAPSNIVDEVTGSLQLL